MDAILKPSGTASSSLVVEDAAPTYTQLREERDRLLKELKRLSERLEATERLAQEYWENEGGRQQIIE